MSERQAILVADLGFGDAGKGTLTDWLVRRFGATVVVRYNGGAQAGHTVVTEDGRQHIFAQFGAGTLVPGVRTHLSRFMVVHPTGLLVEAQVLAKLGVTDALERLSVSPQARMITPFQQAAGRLREVLRGPSRHGSCGLGVGEAVADSLSWPELSAVVGDAHRPRELRRKLLAQGELKRSEFAPHQDLLSEHPEGSSDWDLLQDPVVVERWLEMMSSFKDRVPLGPDQLPDSGLVVFEGAQGLLLDEWRGFHPHTTWSDCTFANAQEILKSWGGDTVRLGVLRTYAVRHGAGPFPTEDPGLCFPEPHNCDGPWQGPVRQGWPDGPLGRYSLAALGGVDGLVLTHCDRLRDGWKVAVAYQEDEPTLGPPRDLGYQETLTSMLHSAKPVYRSGPGEEVASLLEEQMNSPIWVESWGPKPNDKKVTPKAPQKWRTGAS